MKKLLICLFTVSILIGALSLSVCAETHTGTCGTNLIWTLDTDSGILNITGSGSMKDYSSSSYSRSPWYQYKSYIKHIQMADTVTTIGDFAFDDCSNLVDIELSDQIDTIGRYAFSSCSALTKISIPKNVSTIEDRAFEYCSNIEGVYITDVTTWCNIDFSDATANPLYYGNNIYLNEQLLCNLNISQNIKNYAFYNCTSITEAIINSNVTEIGDCAFYKCTELANVDIANGVSSIGTSAFYSCSKLENINLPISITIIPDNAFYATKLKKVDVPEGVTSIGKNAFYNCTLLSEINLPNTLETIGEKAFYYCHQVKTITIPSSVNFIGKDAFYYNNGLETVNTNNLSAWCGIVFENTSSNPLNNTYAENFCVNNKIITTLEIPKGVTSINNYAFMNCSNITNVILSESVTNIGDYAFWSCDNLENIDINYGVNNIGSYAFKYCRKLKSINVPNSVLTIGKGAFNNCSSLQEMSLPFIGHQRGLNETSDSVFGYIFDYAESSVTGTTQQYYKSSTYYYYYIPSSLTKITITDETVIPYGAFYNCVNIEEIILSGFNTTVDDYVFCNCSNLIRAKIDKGIVSIGKDIFLNCSKLEELTLPFVGSKRGISGTYDSVLGYVFKYSEQYVKNYTEQYFSTSNSAYYNIPSTLKKVTILDEEIIPHGAFYGCNNISDIIIKGNPTAIMTDSFGNFFNILNVTIESKDVKFSNTNVFDGSDFVIIHGYSNSTSEQYAEKYQIEFKPIDISIMTVNSNVVNGTIVIYIKTSTTITSQMLHVALYNEHNQMIDYLIVPTVEPFTNTNIVFKDNPDISYAKVFLWEGMQTIAPISEAIKTEIR